MTIRLAHVIYSKDASIWRLRLDPKADGTGDRGIDLPGFSGNIHDPQDFEKIDVTLRVWGAYPDAGGWKDDDGGWVVPVAPSAGQ